MENYQDVNDSVDLTNAILLVGSHVGQYIPKHFTEFFNKDILKRDRFADSIRTLLKGPDAPEYWDAWTNVLDNAIIQGKDGQQFTLHHDEDLWAIPVNS